MKRTFHNRTEYYNENGYLHRIDGPAVEYTNGEKRWYVNTKLHRIEGPAIELKNGEKYWYENNKPNQFLSECYLSEILRTVDIKQFIIDKSQIVLLSGEIFLLRLTIANHFPEYLNFLDKLLILQ